MKGNYEEAPCDATRITISETEYNLLKGQAASCMQFLARIAELEAHREMLLTALVKVGK